MKSNSKDPSATDGAGKAAAISPPISPERLRELYSSMLELRSANKRSKKPNKRQERTILPSEACVVGCTIDLRPTDVVAGVAFQAPYWETRGDAPHQLLMNGTDDVVAIATGIAFAHRMQGSNNVVVVFAPENQAGSPHPSTATAWGQSLPIIYVEAVHSFPSTSSRRKHVLNGIPSVPVDRNDVVAVYRVACEAIEKARRGAGPTVIQCIRYEPRLAKKGSRIGEAADSLAYMEHYLHTRNLWSDELKIAPRHKSSVASRTSSKAKALGSLHGSLSH